MAMKMGKHCFCQKPLTHSIEEARVLSDLARETGVKTQMGNQGTALDGLRQGAEILKSGALGVVSAVHVWTDRPVWPQGIERPAEEAVPDYLHWDEWLGPAKYRPYSPAYHPFKWRGFWDFGTGALGDMGCHTLNMPYMGLDLRDPISVSAIRPEHNQETYPGSSRVEYEFPERKGRKAVTMTWYDGGERPDPALIDQEMIDWLVGQFPDKEIEDPTQLMVSGVLVIGDKGTMFAPGDYAERWMLTGVDTPDVEFERSPGHFTEFADAIEGGPDAVSNFPKYAGPLSETILLGNLAVWSGKQIEWDAERMIPKNAPELESMVRKEYRDGYSLGADVAVAAGG
jgi:predicted dehydrogenase